VETVHLFPKHLWRQRPSSFQNRTALIQAIEKFWAHATKVDGKYVLFDVSRVTSLAHAFDFALYPHDSDISCQLLATVADWNVSRVTSLERMFHQMDRGNVPDLQRWDVSQVTTM